jgi:hemerythrin-like domain-containing protein
LDAWPARQAPGRADLAAGLKPFGTPGSTTVPLTAPSFGVGSTEGDSTMHALVTVGHEHHAALIPRVDELATLASELDTPPPDLRARLIDAHRFITNQLVPHMEQAEATLYPQLERLMQNEHSMTGMRKEHIELRRLVEELGSLVHRDLDFGTRLRLRRVLYRMFAMLKTHLGEEEAYLGVLDHNLSDDEQQALARALAHAMADPA